MGNWSQGRWCPASSGLSSFVSVVSADSGLSDACERQAPASEWVSGRGTSGGRGVSPDLADSAGDAICPASGNPGVTVRVRRKPVPKKPLMTMPFSAANGQNDLIVYSPVLASTHRLLVLRDPETGSEQGEEEKKDPHLPHRRAIKEFSL